jgi:hypothetical protein
MLLLLTPALEAASEIRAFAPGVTTAYAVIREADGDVWYISGQVFEVWGTGARTAADYDISLTDKSGDMFVGDFDTNVSAGAYIVATHYQSGGAPADTDPVVWVDEGNWDGSVWSTGNAPNDVADAVWEEAHADHTTSSTFGGLVAAIKSMTDLMAVVTTTVASPNDANNFTITAGQDVNDAYWMHAIMVEDAGDSHSEVRWIAQYSTSRDVRVDEPFSFTPAASDNVWILGPVYGGYLEMIYNRIDLLSRPVYYYDQTGGAAGGAGGTTYYDQTGDDP